MQHQIEIVKKPCNSTWIPSFRESRKFLFKYHLKNWALAGIDSKDALGSARSRLISTQISTNSQWTDTPVIQSFFQAVVINSVHIIADFGFQMRMNDPWN